MVKIGEQVFYIGNGDKIYKAILTGINNNSYDIKAVDNFGHRYGVHNCERIPIIRKYRIENGFVFKTEKECYEKILHYMMCVRDKAKHEMEHACQNIKIYKKLLKAKSCK